MNLEVWRLGRVTYADGLELMAQAQAARRAGQLDDALLLLEHPPVITLGRGAHATHVLAPASTLAALGVERHETDRGGDVTYHGPGQLVGYPVMFLEPGRQDVRRYVRGLEEAVIRTLAEYGIEATRMEKWPGVWVADSRLGGPRKICAVGVHLSRWYTRHGFALNVAPDLAHFRLIVPCGISEAGVTSMAAELSGEAPSLEAVSSTVAVHFSAVFERPAVEPPAALRTVAVAVTHGARVLLMRRAPARGGFWQLPTGRLEPGEGAAQAAARELAEETGLVAEVASAGVAHAFALGAREGRPRVCVEAPFVARASSPEVTLSSEHDAYAWVDGAEADARLTQPTLRRLAREALTTA